MYSSSLHRLKQTIAEASEDLQLDVVAYESNRSPPLIPDLFARVNQDTTWEAGAFNMLALFHDYKTKNSQAFELSLSAEQLEAVTQDVQPSQTLIDVWPIVDNVLKRVLGGPSSFDQVLRASRQESMEDPIAEYLHDVLFSYAKYFRFSKSIPSDLREHEGYANLTWTLIGGAFTLLDIETRYLEVPVKAVEQRRNADRNPFLDTKAQAHMTNGVAFRGSNQNFLSEAPSCGICARIAQYLAVFGSTTFNARTAFYMMGLVGAFWLQEIRSMVIPLSKSDFGPRMREGVETYLEVTLMVKEELNRRELAAPIPQTQTQMLLQACKQMAVTSATPTNPKKRK
ncbi:hypothetical protein BGX33_001654 [Mortierella sp. NVP41]|nr:hypothetical protein BGX33_001654 [Mortierella sp. NVP41]